MMGSDDKMYRLWYISISLIWRSCSNTFIHYREIMRLLLSSLEETRQY